MLRADAASRRRSDITTAIELTTRTHQHRFTTTAAKETQSVCNITQFKTRIPSRQNIFKQPSLAAMCLTGFLRRIFGTKVTLFFKAFFSKLSYDWLLC